MARLGRILASVLLLALALATGAAACTSAACQCTTACDRGLNCINTVILDIFQAKICLPAASCNALGCSCPAGSTTYCAKGLTCQTPTFVKGPKLKVGVCCKSTGGAPGGCPCFPNQQACLPGFTCSQTLGIYTLRHKVCKK